MFERLFVQAWNSQVRITGIGRPIFHFQAKTNFLGLSEETAAMINNFYNANLPLKGTNYKIDVLKNRRHQFIGVYMPATFAVVMLFQFAKYHLTKAPTIVRQTPAPGWEVPEGYNFHHLEPRPANVALWRKRQEMGNQEYDYTQGTVIDLAVGTHTWYHGQDAHMTHEFVNDPGLSYGEEDSHGGGHH